MKPHKKSNIKHNIKITAIAVLCIAVFIITFADNKYIPNWNDIFNAFGLAPHIDDTLDYIEIMDVGQGDSILIRSNGKSVLIDQGPEESAKKLCKDLKALSIEKIDISLTTHLHMDHIGGLNEILNKFDVKNLILTDLNSTAEGTTPANVAKQTIIGASGGVFTAVQGMHMDVGDFQITVLCYYSDLSEENNHSIVTMAEIDNLKFLLMGDAEKEVEQRLINDNINVSCDVLKVGHHGSSSSSSDNFIKAASPDYAAISCGADNKYLHPHKETLETLEKYDAEIFRTDTDGNITFYIDGGKLSVETEK